MNNQKYLNSNLIHNICLTGLIMGLTLSSYYLANSFPLGAIGSFDIHLMFFIFGLMFIKDKTFKIFFFISIPFLSIFNTNILSINYLQVFVEYFLVYYCFFIFLFFNFITIKMNKTFSYIVFIFLVISSFAFRLTLHVLSGIWWWGAPNILFSFFINIRLLIMDWIFIIPLMIISFPVVRNFNNKL